MGGLLRRLRTQLALFLALTTLAVGHGVWLEVSGEPPVTMPIGLGASENDSADFRVLRRGLYLVVLQAEPLVDPDHLPCEVGTWRSSPPAHCSKPLPISWSIHDRGALIARDALGPARAVDDVLRGRSPVERELGAVSLEPGREYSLRVHLTEEGRRLPLRDKVVLVRLHPWDVKNSMGELLLFCLFSLAAIGALLCLLVSFVGELRRATAR